MRRARTEVGLEGDISAAVRILGADIRAFEEITRLQNPKNQRACFRLQFEDGRVAKARRFPSAAMRESFSALAPSLEGLPFSRILATHGAVTVEEWVPGSSVDPHAFDIDAIRRLARVLGRLHTWEAPADSVPDQVPHMEWYSLRMEEQLALLVERGELDAGLADEVFGLAMDGGAVSLQRGVIHTDFHPRNMVVDASGEIWIIDNEDLRIGALDYDIAKCWRQWPMSRYQRVAFAESYVDSRSLDAFFAHEKFWSICTLVNAAKLRSRHGQPTEPVLEELESLAQRNGDALWPDLP